MKSEKIRVYFTTGYNGSVKAGVSIGDEASGHSMKDIEEKGLSKGKDYVLDLDWLSARLEKEIEEKGYTISQSKRQKYPRLIVNE